MCSVYVDVVIKFWSVDDLSVSLKCFDYLWIWNIWVTDETINDTFKIKFEASVLWVSSKKLVQKIWTKIHKKIPFLYQYLLFTTDILWHSFLFKEMSREDRLRDKVSY